MIAYPLTKTGQRVFPLVIYASLLALALGCLLASGGCTAAQVDRFLMGADRGSTEITLTEAERAKLIADLEALQLIVPPEVPSAESDWLEMLGEIGGYALTFILGSMGIYGTGRVGVFLTGLRKKQ